MFSDEAEKTGILKFIRSRNDQKWYYWKWHHCEKQCQKNLLLNSEEKDKAIREKEHKGKTMEIRIVTKRVWKNLHWYILKSIIKVKIKHGVLI